MAPEVTSYELHDPAFPVAELLVGEAVGELAAHALRALADLELLAIAPRQIGYRPGAIMRVLYDVTVVYPDGSQHEEDLVAAASTAAPPTGEYSIVLDSPAGPVAFWRYPWDPLLPGLEVAWDTNTLLGMLEASGVGRLQALPELRAVSYSPASHGVIEIELTTGPRRKAQQRTLYLKLVQPDEAGHIQRAHVELADVLPVPRCLAWSGNLGLLVMDAVAGEPLWQRVLEGGPLPGPDAFLDVLDRLAGTRLSGEELDTSGEVAAASGAILKATAPDEAERVDRLLAYYAAEEPQPLTTVHGDLHENQVLLADGAAEITGIVDLDEVGPGRQIDDMAMLVGRLWSNGPIQPDHAADFERYGVELFEGFARRLGSASELHRRCGAVMVSRATNPFRHTSANWREETAAFLDVAERWMNDGPR